MYTYTTCTVTLAFFMCSLLHEEMNFNKGKLPNKENYPFLNKFKGTDSAYTSFYTKITFSFQPHLYSLVTVNQYDFF